MTHQNVDGLLFADMVRGGAARLRANAQAVDDMNVFPIPDGDTGDNMRMTIEAAAPRRRRSAPARPNWPAGCCWAPEVTRA